MAYEAKTLPTQADVAAFLDRVEPAVRREDGKVVCELMRRVSGEEPQMWGSSIVGFGRHAYRYASGHSGETVRIGFSPRKTSLVFYMWCDASEQAALLARLGKHSTGVGCLYIKKLADVDTAVLEEAIRAAWAHTEPVAG